MNFYVKFRHYLIEFKEKFCGYKMDRTRKRYSFPVGFQLNQVCHTSLHNCLMEQDDGANPFIQLMYKNNDAKYENGTISLLKETLDYRQYSDCYLYKVFIPFITTDKVKIYINQLVLNSCHMVLENITFYGNLVLKDCHRCKIKNCIFDGSGDLNVSLQIEDSEDISVEDCEFFDNNSCALLVFQSKEIELSNSLFRNCNTGLEIINSHITLTSSIFQNNFMACIKSELSELKIEKCDFLNSTMNSIIFNKSIYTIQECKFDQCKGTGILDKGNSSGNIMQNKFKNINKYSIDIVNKSKVVVTKNKINESTNGILIHQRAIVHTVNNIIKNINNIGIEAKDSATIYMESDIIENICYIGILIQDNSSANIKLCKILDTYVNGIAAMNSRKLTKITQTSIMNCKDTAIGAYMHSNVEVLDSHLYNISNFAFATSGYSLVTAKNNRIKSVRVAFVSIEFYGSGIFESNRVINCSNREFGKIQSNIIFDNNSGFNNTFYGDPFYIARKINDEKQIDYVPRPLLCCRCNKERNLVKLKCGHFIVCKECAKKEKACPYCRFQLSFVDSVQIRSIYNAASDDTCLICCFQKCDDVIVKPCNHTGFCKDCLEKWLRAKHTCPICRQTPATIAFIKKKII